MSYAPLTVEAFSDRETIGGVVARPEGEALVENDA